MVATKLGEISLYPFQITAVTNTLAEIERRDAALLVLPTGTGKTVLACEIARRIVEESGRVLILAHTGELLDQWAESCDRFGLKWVVEKAEQDGHGDSVFGRADVVLGSVATLRGKRLARWPEKHFDVVICDESHHGTAKSYLDIFSHFSHARRIGLTATPERGDGEKIQEVFGECAFEYPLWKAIADGYLVPPIFLRPPCSIDLSKVANCGDDLNQGDLEDEVAAHIEELVNGAKKEIGSRMTMAFTPRVASAQLLAAGFRQVGVTANSVHGGSEDRDTVVKEFKAQQYQCLCSCSMLLEGFDARPVSALVMARPTKSSILFRQMLGRGLRTYPGKSECCVIDFALNSGRHDLFRPIDLFDTTGMDLRILDAADRLMKAGEKDPRKALHDAEEVHRLEVAKAVAIREREPQYRLVAFDPFHVSDLLGIPRRERNPTAKKLSAPNSRRLESLKLETQGVDDASARRLIKEIDRRKAVGLATHRQVAALISKGVPQSMANTMSFDEAKGDLDIIFGWTRSNRGYA